MAKATPAPVPAPAKHRDVPAIPTAGTFGAPPPHAPYEVSQPLAAETLADQMAKAAQHERVLPPFDPPKGVPLVPKTAPAATVPTAVAAPVSLPEPVPPAPPSVAMASAQDSGPAPGEAPSIPPRSHQPAASDTDSPSRGQPRPSADRGKQITGGFGMEPGGSYFALDGTEVKEVARGLMDTLNASLDKDLRLSLAITYPQVRIAVTLTVDGSAPGAPIHAFDLTEARILTLVETRQDDTITPADALRDEMDLVKPRKQLVQTGAGRQIVDVVVDPLAHP